MAIVSTGRLGYRPALSMAFLLSAWLAMAAWPLFTADAADRPVLRLAQINAADGPAIDLSAKEASPPVPAGQQIQQVLVMLPLSASDSLADDIARHYGLQTVAHGVSSVLSRRLVVYQVPPSRTLNELVATLSADPRVSSAQPNLRYHPLPQQPAPVAANPQHRMPHRSAKYAKSAEPSARSTPIRQTARTRSTSRGVNTAIASPPARHAPSSGERRTSSGGAGLRWPSADEPFVGPKVANR